MNLFWRGEADLSTLNQTHIALIPKVTNPNSPADFRPISLCNVAHKIISKILAERIKEVLLELISSEQGAFLSKQAITDNIMLGTEAFHWIQRRRTRRWQPMAIKLDLSKAYDIIEWDFLRLMMLKFGFPEKLVNWSCFVPQLHLSNSS